MIAVIVVMVGVVWLVVSAATSLTIGAAIRRGEWERRRACRGEPTSVAAP
jgi:predicted signal transduction protein with EAL and GGDEF domain